MTRLAHLAIATGALFAAMPAQAADFLIDTAAGTSNNRAIVNNNSNYSYSTINYAVKSSDGKTTLNVRATAWTRDLDGNFAAAKIGSWGANGLGIYQTNEGVGGNYHTIDNKNGWEFLVLQFDQAVSLQSAVLTPYVLSGNNYSDNDAFIARGFSDYATTMTAATLKSLSDGLKVDITKQSGDAWFNSNSDNYSSNKQTYNLSPSKNGNVWVIGGSFFGPDNKNDAFKLSSVAVTSAVPEPTTWMTMILGFGMIGAAARRRRSSSKGALA
ncbi:MAG: PEPxxWA-CTERM sorting domain-containing protein [Sphingomonas phyllosphaerae]|uniref:PEPxxWA-CTERM sorting domain-containing protein n=1 Tax=Sphingomonas phyllosphaerae TaxID=257003 RepID=UPI002FFC13C1